MSGRPHRVDVAERVRHGNLAECVGIVHDRGEEIDGLDDGQVGTKAIDPGVFRMLHPHDQVRIGDERQILQRFLQVTRTYLAGSPGPVDRPGQAHLHFLVHVGSPPFVPYRPAAGGFRRENLTDIVSDCQGFQKEPERTE